MMKITGRIVCWLLLGGCLPVAAGDIGRLTDSLAYRGEVQVTAGNGEHSPLWLNSNKYGLSSVDCHYGYVRGALERPLTADDGRRWGVGYGVDVAVGYGMTSTLVVHQAFAEARWLKGVLTVGSKEQPMELKNGELSSGAQTLGINARPIPQVRLTLPDYWTIPYTRQWLALKGHIAYGKPTDSRWQKDFTEMKSRYVEGDLYHSKAGYLRVGPKNITVELGLEMACKFGGTCRWSADDPGLQAARNLKSFWHALIPGGSDMTDGDPYLNTEGDNLGSWVARLNFDYPKWNLGVYADHFFEDHSSMFHLDYDGYGEGEEWNSKSKSRYFMYDFKDWMLGAELRLKENAWLHTIVVEYLYTKYQGGPIYHDHAKDNPIHISGRDNFYNHSSQTGWQHWGMVIGNPLYRSPLYNDDGTIRVLNNRFVAWHGGISGDMARGLHYRLLATWQRGYGTYDDLFRDPEENVSMLAEACYQFAPTSPLAGWSVKGAVAFDHGGIYGNNRGIQLTIVKSGLLKK